MNKLLDRVTYDPDFQAACQRYHHEGGSSRVIAGAALRAAMVPSLLEACRGLLETPAAKPYLRVSPYREIAEAIAQLEGGL
ncbi:hypothetical protein [Sphingomonas sp. SRS2]|uniref:hypothetical protein n=1 Tax=Sphingomonas sp. SRS2 TaxID=133190 RepID=UPI0006184654|nr:hypothetical protein [Sphingomonas sp. SRS2]KKC24683.1 hypothetical protein WP12_17775 [Sphingomonas sp. SRS2]